MNTFQENHHKLFPYAMPSSHLQPMLTTSLGEAQTPGIPKMVLVLPLQT